MFTQKFYLLGFICASLLLGVLPRSVSAFGSSQKNPSPAKAVQSPTVQASSPACPIYGDVDHNGLMDMDDILVVLDGFAGTDLTGDIEPCGGDGDIDVDDILAILDAFSGYDRCDLPLGINIYNTAQSGHYLYVGGRAQDLHANPYPSLEVLDVCNPASPKVVNSLTTEEEFNFSYVEISAERSLLAAMGSNLVDFQAVLQFYSLVNPLRPTLISTIRAEGDLLPPASDPNYPLNYFNGVFSADGNRFYLTVFDEGFIWQFGAGIRYGQGLLFTLDITNPANPVVLNQTPITTQDGFPDAVNHCLLSSSGTEIYCPGATSLKRVDLSNRDYPVLHSSPNQPYTDGYSWPSGMSEIFFELDGKILENDNVIYMARNNTQTDEITTWDKNSLLQIHKVESAPGACDWSFSSMALSADSQYLVAEAFGCGGFDPYPILTLANPEAPAFMDLSGNPVAAAYYDPALHLSFPQPPGVGESFHFTFYFHVNGNHLYEGSFGIFNGSGQSRTEVWDISDFLHPVWVEFLD